MARLSQNIGQDFDLSKNTDDSDERRGLIIWFSSILSIVIMVIIGCVFSFKTLYVIGLLLVATVSVTILGCLVYMAFVAKRYINTYDKEKEGS